MKRVAGLLALILAVCLGSTSDVQGSLGGGPAGKTTGPSVTIAVVMDLTGVPGDPQKGVTAIRAQRAGTSTGVLFQSTLANQSSVTCQDVLNERAQNFDRFEGLIDTWVNSPWLESLIQPFGTPTKAAISSTDYAACTTTNGRAILSFVAVIQFQP